MLDSGGARRVDMVRSVVISCVSGSIGQTRHFDLTPFVETQSGSPEDTVSNDLFAAYFVTPGDYADSCSPGYTVTSVVYAWGIEGTDFHGNNTTWATGGKVVYQP